MWIIFLSLSSSSSLIFIPSSRGFYSPTKEVKKIILQSKTCFPSADKTKLIFFFNFFFKEVTKILLCAAQSSHQLVPPDVTS